MLAHGASRLGRVLIGNAGHDERMLALDALEISPPLGRRVNRKPHALARNDVAAPSAVSVGQVMRTILPFYGALIAALFLVTYVPAFSLALPNLFLGKF